MQRSILSDKCYTSREYIKMITGVDLDRDITLGELDKCDFTSDLWDYCLSDIDVIIANERQVVLVRFPLDAGGTGYVYRLCEVEGERP